MKKVEYSFYRNEANIRISLGSLMETMTCIEISLNQKYINQSEYEKAQELIQELYFKLISLDKFLTDKN